MTGMPNADSNSDPFPAKDPGSTSFRRAILRRADRARGFAAISSLDALCALPLSRSNLAGSLLTGGAWRLTAGASTCPRMKRFTSLSSRE